jgi:hypothetical protein
MIGGTVGAQIQQGFVMLGIEGDLDWANVKGNGIASNISASKFDRPAAPSTDARSQSLEPRSRSSHMLPIPISVSEATISAFSSSIARVTPASTHFKRLS